MGGRRLSPGQAVDALDEAIDVIRGIWAADDRAPLRVDGEYYTLDGAKRGPAPAHDIPIWIGAYKPRMLRLIGRKGDGWLPSLPTWSRVTCSAATRRSTRRHAARAAIPREIRRLLNISGRFSASCRGLLDGPHGSGSTTCCPSCSTTAWARSSSWLTTPRPCSSSPRR